MPLTIISYSFTPALEDIFSHEIEFFKVSYCRQNLRLLIPSLLPRQLLLRLRQ